MKTYTKHRILIIVTFLVFFALIGVAAAQTYWWQDHFVDTSKIDTALNILLPHEENWSVETISHLPGSHEVVVADVDEDNDMDLIIDQYNKDTILWLENGNNWKAHLIDNQTLIFAHDVQIGDIDGDGRWDVIGCSLSDNKSYFSGNSSIKWYQRPVNPKMSWNTTVIANLTNLPGARQLAIGDLDKDGDNDVVVAVDNSNHLIWLQNPGGADSFNGSKWNNYTLDSGAESIKYVLVADIDRDDNVDIVASILGSNAGTFVYFAPDDPTNISGWKKVKISPYKCYGLDIADLDEDGDIDIVAGGGNTTYSNRNLIIWYENPYPNGVRNGNYSYYTIQPDTYKVDTLQGIRAVDLDEDDDLDVIAAINLGSTTGEIKWYENQGNPKGTWISHLLTNDSHYTAWTHEIGYGDMDGDCHQDIIVLGTNSMIVSILKNRLFGITGNVTKWKCHEEMNSYQLNAYNTGSSFTFRNLVHSSTIPVSGDKIRVRFFATSFPTTYTGFNITKVYLAEVDPRDDRDIVDASRVNVTFNNGDDSTGLVPPGESIWSDIIDFNLNQSTNYSITAHSIPTSFSRIGGSEIGYYYRRSNYINDLDWSDDTPDSYTRILGLYEIVVINSSNITSVNITPSKPLLDKWGWSRFYVNDSGNITYYILDEHNNIIVSNISSGYDMSFITNPTIKLYANFTPKSIYDAQKIFWWGIVLGGIYKDIINTVYPNGTYNYGTPPFGYSHVDMSITPSNTINLTVSNFNLTYKKWTESSTSSTTVNHIIGSNPANTDLHVYVNQSYFNTYQSNSSGYINFTYDLEFSTTEFIIQVASSLPDQTPPASITNLQNTSGTTWINWTWENPTDPDFNHTMVYLDGVWETNTSDPFYNATALAPNTCYETGTHTVDLVGNVNETWVNQTTRTLALPDTTPPASITNLQNVSGQTWINWSWGNPLDADFNYTVVYLDGEWQRNSSDPFYNASGLEPDTDYKIGTQTVDLVGNINETWVNRTTKTKAATTWYVDDSGGADFTKIQDAVNSASAGDTIIVRDGTYTENVKVAKPQLTIRCSEKKKCVVDASDQNDHVFNVTADWVNISGFTVQNATGTVKAGIYLNNVDHCNISENTASNNWYGIYLSSSSTNNLTGNTANSNNYGIYLNSSNNNLIYNNYFNNTNNARDYGTNIWNITKTLGTNIIGGPYLGGNYWSDYTGIDADGDGLGETPVNIPGGTNKDYLPLVILP